jgi:ribonuclease D
LVDLWAAVEADLNANNKLSIARQEFDYLTRRQERAVKVDRWRGVTGIHELKDQRQLTIVKHLWEVRENLAKDKDVAPGRLIPDGSIIAAVKANPKSRSELSSLRSFTGRASRTYIDDWWNALQKGQTTLDLVELRPKSTGIPNHRNWPSKFPEANARFLWSKKLLAELSVEIQIPVENIVSPDTVKAICFEPPQLELQAISDYLLNKGVRQWQCELVAEHFLFALSQITPPKAEEEPKA